MRKQPALASLFSVCALAICFRAAHAERLPVHRFTIADGLPSNSINCVVRDSRNFLWFCTSEGLSRFDGYAFVNYGVDHGLPDPVVTTFVESASGEYWVGTPRGLLRFNTKPLGQEPMFAPFASDRREPARHIHELLAGRNGNVWAATNAGIFLLTKDQGRWTSHHIEFPGVDSGSEGPLMEDHAGNVWVAFGNWALYRRAPNGKIEKLDDPFIRGNRILSLFEDRDGRIWLGSYRGLGLIDHPRPGSPLVGRVYTKKDGLLEDVAGGVFQSSDGRLWVGAGALYQIVIDADPKNVKFKLYGRQEDGFGGINAEDVQGNLWMASTRMAPHGFVSYDRSDGLAPDDVRAILEGHDGELYVITGTHSRFIHRFDGRRFTTVAPVMPAYESTDWFWGWGQIHFPDRNGEWWVATIHGLLRYPPVKRLEELAHKTPHVYSTHDGLPGEDLFRLYEDSRGNVWVGTWSIPRLGRWDRASGRFHSFTVSEGWLPTVPTAFAEDRSGGIWIGLWVHYLARYRNGRFTIFNQANNLPDCMVVSLFLDHAGQLWVGTNRGGLLRLTDPAADHPQFVAYTTQQGLSSNNVRAITEDHWGRIYFWTARGVDRLEPATGRIRHYTTADGLVPAGSDHQVAFSDRHGRLWFGFQGLSRLDPEADRPNPPRPPIRITGIRVRGVPYPVSELGETNLSGLVLQPNQNQLEISFAGLNFGVGDVPRYQYKLEGSGSDWSPLSELRTVNFAEVRPGTYRFLVRTINAEGVASSSPAVLSFRVLAPVWQRWWFLALLVAVVVLMIYALHRYRVAQLVALERIRTRIASDLHDDIGAGLSQIAILSEVAKRDVKRNASGAEELLDHVANVSRELVDSMSEIVWAVSPRRDSLNALVQRMRRFGSDLLAPRDIEFDFRVLLPDHDLELRPDLCRQSFLIFKEAVNNAARHADCTSVNVSLSFDKSEIVLAICDDGRGLEATPSEHGHGLASMRRRAGEMDGHIELTSERGAGTRVVLRVPLKRRPIFSSTRLTTT